MTLTLELSPELEQRLQTQAQAHGQDVQAFAIAVLERSAPEIKAPDANGLSPRQRAARRLYGCLPSNGHKVDDFLHERRQEAEREMQATAARQAPAGGQERQERAA